MKQLLAYFTLCVFQGHRYRNVRTAYRDTSYSGIFPISYAVCNNCGTERRFSSLGGYDKLRDYPRDLYGDAGMDKNEWFVGFFCDSIVVAILGGFIWWLHWIST